VRACSGAELGSGGSGSGSRDDGGDERLAGLALADNELLLWRRL